MNPELLQKINDLFDYRRLPRMAKRLEVDPAIYPSKLVDLQEAIFHYDSHLEENLLLDMNLLEDLWKDMEEALSNLGYKEERCLKLLRQIAVYAENEMSTRKGSYLSDYPIKYFYYYKSCDVRLMRQILLDHAQTKDDWQCRDWMYFDWVTEINDDICDVEEDLGTYNGNRFLDSLKRVGVKDTLKEYDDFLLKIKNQNETQKDQCYQSTWGEWIYNATMEEIIKTRELLNPELYAQFEQRYD